MSDARRIRDQGWRQGSLLPAASIRDGVHAPAPLTPSDEGLFMIVSQDCDLIHEDFDTEPFAELLLWEPATKPRPDWHHGKNPRHLQIRARRAAEDLWIETHAWARATIDRRRLATFSPDPEWVVDGRDVRLVAAWLGKRYLRPAFPDAFNERLTPARSKLANTLKDFGGPIEKIFIHVDPDDELPPDRPYRLVVWLVMSADDYADEDQRSLAEKAVLPMERQLSALPGIDVTDCQLRSAEQVTLDDASYLQHWDFDYLTHRAETET